VKYVNALENYENILYWIFRCGCVLIVLDGESVWMRKMIFNSMVTGFEIDNQNIAKMHNQILNQQNDCILRLTEAIQVLCKAVMNNTELKLKTRK
jgi:hypothetical protein